VDENDKKKFSFNKASNGCKVKVWYKLQTNHRTKHGLQYRR